MMPSDYVGKNDTVVAFDLDAVTDVVGGFSRHRPGWTAIVIYIPATNTFVELRSSPQNIRGDSEDEALEVDANYIAEAFAISEVQLASIKSHPSKWRFIDRRPNA